MITIEWLTSAALYLLAGVILARVFDRLTVILRNNVPGCDTLFDVLRYPLDLYTHYFRFFVPDTIYKLWLQTGIMDKEQYEYAQEQGYISDDLEPKYIQRYTGENDA